MWQITYVRSSCKCRVMEFVHHVCGMRGDALVHVRVDVKCQNMWHTTYNTCACRCRVMEYV